VRLRRTASHTTIFPSVVSRFTRASLSTHVTFDRYDARLTDGASLSTSPPARFDADGDGVINRDELERLLDEFGTARHASATRIIEEDSAETFEAEMFKPLIDYPSVYATPEGVKTAMEMIDGDGGGEISLEEFVQWYARECPLPPRGGTKKKKKKSTNNVVTIDIDDVDDDAAVDEDGDRRLLEAAAAADAELSAAGAVRSPHTGSHTTALAW
jgi:Ca2+-binding EF-hand superfamily protein